MIEVDRVAMLRLPPVLPDPSLQRMVRVGRDHYVRLGTCDYSVHPKAIGRRVEVRVGLDDVVAATAGEIVAQHQRCSGRHQVLTDPAHAAARDNSATSVAPCEPGTRTSNNATCRSMTASERPDGLHPRSRAEGGSAFLCRALQAPSLAGPYPRLAERARAVGWSFVDYLAACLEGEVSARQDHGGEIRIRAARLPARKTLEEFDTPSNARTNATGSFTSPREKNFTFSDRVAAQSVERPLTIWGFGELNIAATSTRTDGDVLPRCRAIAARQPITSFRRQKSAGGFSRSLQGCR